jgi:hypothetical protein
MKVLLDFDSTVFPLLDAMRGAGGTRISYADMPTYESLPERAGGLQAMLDLFQQVMPFSAMQAYAPFPGCVGWLQRLSEAGAEFLLVTDRPDHLAADVQQYLDHFGIAVTAVHCQSGIDKRTLVREQEIGLVIDDHPTLIGQLAEDGVQTAALQFPYNAQAITNAQSLTGPDWDALGPVLLAFVIEAVSSS